MKTFDLEKAKAGAFVCTREGFRARIVWFDADNDRFPIVALLKSDNGKEYTDRLQESGKTFRFRSPAVYAGNNH